jgi:hypothetical protein
MSKKFILEADSSLTVLDDNDGKGNADGSQVGSRLNIHADQIAKHRRDPAFDAALKAAAGKPGNLSIAQLAEL